MIPPDFITDLKQHITHRPEFRTYAIPQNDVVAQTFKGGISLPVTLQEYADLCLAVARGEAEEPKTLTCTKAIQSFITNDGDLVFASVIHQAPQ